MKFLLVNGKKRKNIKFSYEYMFLINYIFYRFLKFVYYFLMYKVYFRFKKRSI